jgi:hypothetical protein
MLFQVATGLDMRRKAGRKPQWTPEIQEFVLDLLYHNCQLYQDEVADEIYDQFGTKLKQSAMSRLYSSLGITHKKLSIMATESDPELVNWWRDKQRQWKLSQLVFVDESASNKKNGQRRWGWAPVGMDASQKQWLKRSER